MTQLVRVGHSY